MFVNLLVCCLVYIYICLRTTRIVGITDYEEMFADTIRGMKQIHGITSAQVFTIRPRRGASSDETGVDVHYMTNFSRGKCHEKVFIVID